ncbi:MAG: hypothetical protein JNL09_06125, partial [Anaerolineales bacterium]|nr:hypothetical protein [Anaerolineales bacterium]
MSEAKTTGCAHCGSNCKNSTRREVLKVGALMAVAATAAACGPAKNSPTAAGVQSKPATSQPTPIPHLSAQATP